MCAAGRARLEKPAWLGSCQKGGARHARVVGVRERLGGGTLGKVEG